MTTQPIRVMREVVLPKVEARLVTAGLLPEQAALEARLLLEPDLHGVPSHGLRMLPGLLAGLEKGIVTARPDVRIVREKGATCLLHGDNGPGRSVAWRAMEEALTRARQFGIGLCLAAHTTHWGRAHSYACQAAQQGFLGICTTNGMPCMAGWGSRERIIGNNPLAIGVPRRGLAEPIVFDMAMSQAAVGKVATWLREGRKIPEGWGFDQQGGESKDGAAILAGAVQPCGGHKGAGLALMVELLTAGLAAGLFGPDIAGKDRSGLDPEASKLFIAIDPLAFYEDIDHLTEHVANFLHHLHAAASSAEENFVWPGQRGWLARAENLRLGVPLHPEIVQQLAAIGLAL